MDSDQFKVYKTTEEYKDLSPKSKSRLRDKYRYMEKKKDPDFQAKKKEANEKQNQLSREKTLDRKMIKYLHWLKDFLLKHPDHELGKRCLHRIFSGGEVDLTIFGKMDEKDIENLKSFVLPEIPVNTKKNETSKKWREEHHEKSLEHSRKQRERKKVYEDEEEINRLFRVHDGNALISDLEIQHENLCYIDRFCQKEVAKYEKYHFLQNAEKEEFLKKCKEEFDNYLKEVESLSMEEKKQFLKNKNIV